MSRRFAPLARALVLALVATAAQAQAPQPAPAFDLQAHRGARGLLPENSIEGFRYTLGLGVSTLETDIAITRDKVLVLSHDPVLNPDITRGPNGQFLSSPGPAIVSLSAAELAQYDVGRLQPGSAYARQFPEQKPVDGTRIPRLQELFALVKRSKNDTVQLALETKVTPEGTDTLPAEEFTRLLIAAVRDAGMEERTSILSFDWRTLLVVQREAPKIATVYLSVQQPWFDTISADNPRGSAWTNGIQHKDYGSVPRMVKAAGGHTWSSFWRDLTPAKVKEAKDLGLKVLAWTVNDPGVMRQMMDMGVSGIVTDRPDLLRAEMAKRGLPLPAPTPVPD